MIFCLDYGSRDFWLICGVFGIHWTDRFDIVVLPTTITWTNKSHACYLHRLLIMRGWWTQTWIVGCFDVYQSKILHG